MAASTGDPTRLCRRFRFRIITVTRAPRRSSSAAALTPTGPQPSTRAPRPPIPPAIRSSPAANPLPVAAALCTLYLRFRLNTAKSSSSEMKIRSQCESTASIKPLTFGLRVTVARGRSDLESHHERYANPVINPAPQFTGTIWARIDSGIQSLSILLPRLHCRRAP